MPLDIVQISDSQYYLLVDQVELPAEPGVLGWHLLGETMRALEIIVALIVALVVFVVVKLLGLVIHVAIVAAVIGLIVGFIIARMFRRD
jgi:hypothetical protein